MQVNSSRSPIVAVLGPTNTGKTHLAMERMLAQPSGMMGFPLRLLARENYDKACKIKGQLQVALITGEEKIIPPTARYFICTVESMPVDRPVEFLGIDEVQMCADPDRGHIFTERVLRARGISETMFLGAETIRPLLEALVPDIEVQTRPRLSTLVHIGYKKVSRLPPRSALVAFSANKVYELAELVRRQRGGAAVVLGALSPRTRNAQVEMYQAGEVDYLVATDAIGMGLNMDIDHVAFAGTTKFDGRQRRRLTAAELAQAAGRAGRHMNDGTFGTTANEDVLDEDLAAAIESHEFDAIRQLSWRSGRLDFSSVDALIQSLNTPPPHGALTRARQADDEVFLTKLLERPDVRARAITPDTVRLLWDICQVPDFEKVLSDAHAGLLATLYLRLTEAEGCLPTDWMAAQVSRLDRTEGDIDTLTQRIATVRTWTYISFQSAWVADPVAWQSRTREIEDKLSDALHERLTQRFVDRDTAHLVKRLKERPDLLAAVRADGEVLVEGVPVGDLKGFRYVSLDAPATGASKSVSGAVQRALKGEMTRRVQAMTAAADETIKFVSLSGPDAGVITWGDAPVARLVKGDDIRRPRIKLLPTDLLGPQERDRVVERLNAWLAADLEKRFEAVERLKTGQVDGIAKGIAHQLWEAFGSTPRRTLDDDLKACDKAGRYQLRRLGVVIGRETVYQNSMLKPAQAAMRGFLWCLWTDRSPVPEPPGPGLCSLATDAGLPSAFYDAVGFRAIKGLAVRVDILERVAEMAWTLSKEGPFPAKPELMNPVGCGPEDLHRILKALGFKAIEKDGETLFRPAKRPGAGKKSDSEKVASKKGKGKKSPHPSTSKPKPEPAIDPDSPFAALAKLKAG